MSHSATTSLDQLDLVSQRARPHMEAHNAVLLEALAGLSELDFPMQDLLALQRQVVLMRKKGIAQQLNKMEQPETKAISTQQIAHLDTCEAYLVSALDSFNTYLLGFLASKACDKLRKDLGGPSEGQSWDEWLDTLSKEQLAALGMPLDAVDLLKSSGYANMQKPQGA